MKESIEKKTFVCAVTYSSNIGKKWFIKYKVPDYVTGDYKTLKYSGQINKFDTVELRLQEIENIKNLIVANEPLPNFQGARKLSIQPLERNFASITKLFYAGNDKRKKTVELNTYTNYKSKILQLERWLISKNLSTISIGKFTIEYAELFLDNLLQNGFANSTYNDFKTLFSTFTDDFIAEKKVPIVNVWRAIKSLKDNKKPFQPYTAAIENIIANELPKFDTQQWIFMQLTYYGYIRGTENMKLKIENIDFFNKCIRLYKTKNGGTRTVVITDELIDLLLKLEYDKQPGDYYLFTAKGVPGEKMIGKNYFNRKWKEFRELHKIPDIYKSYGAKPTGMIKQRRNNRDTKEIQMQADHHSLDQTNDYLRTMDATHLEDFRNSFPKIGEQPQPKKETEIMAMLKEILQKMK